MAMKDDSTASLVFKKNSQPQPAAAPPQRAQQAQARAKATARQAQKPQSSLRFKSKANAQAPANMAQRLQQQNQEAIAMRESSLRFKSQANPWSPPAKANPLGDLWQQINGWWNKTRAGVQGQPQQNPNEIYGVTYGPGWQRDWFDESAINPATGQKYGANWRRELAPILATPDEALRRRQAYREQFQPGYKEWQRNALWAASNLAPADYNRWKQEHPRPTGFLQTQQEYILRENAAPTGEHYIPYGPGFVVEPSLPDLPTQEQGTGGGGSGGSGGSDYGGGGGGWGGWDNGGSYNPSEAVRQYYNNMINWSINQPNRGG